MNDNNTKASSIGGFLSKLLDFLGSMNLAVILLLTLCLIMLAGTLTEQSQSLVYYQEIYGPFWTQVFEAIRLFNLYDSVWFLFVVLLLVSSITACVWRNAPRIIESFGKDAKEYHPGRFLKSRHWDINQYEPSKIKSLEDQLIKRKYAISYNYTNNETHLYARKGGLQKLGYLLIHISILTIIIGGLLDGRAFSVFSSGSAQSQNTSNAFSIIQSFGISELVHEIHSSQSGVLTSQKLPFTMQVIDATDHYYANGSISDYSARINIIPDNGEPEINAVVTADKSFQHQGYTIAHRGNSGVHGLVNLSLMQFGHSKLLVDNENLSMPYEYIGPNNEHFLVDGFKSHNSDPSKDISLSEEFQDVGPSMSYQLQGKNGQLVKFHYYLEPILKDGNSYYLLRASTYNQPPVLLFIPIHENSGLSRFLSFNNVLYSREFLTLMVNANIKVLFSTLELDSEFLKKEMAQKILQILTLYAEGGRDLVLNTMIEEFKDADRDTAALFVEKMLDAALYLVYEQVVLNEKPGADANTKPIAQLSREESRYLKDLLLSVEQMKSLGINIFPLIHNYEQRKAVVLNIAKQPGKYVVISAMFVLFVGVLLTFYVNYREYFIRVVPEHNTARVYVDGYTNRQDLHFNYEFNNLSDVLMSVTV